ncbi:MAG: ABC transporter substrate-binding protein [Pseudomonadota bacterium]
MTFLAFTRRALVGGLAALAAAAFAPASAQEDFSAEAEAYVQAALDEVIGALSIGDEAEKRKRLRELVEKYIDTQRVALSTLGNYRRQATREQLREFIPLFKDYAIGQYEEQIVNYSGERFAVTGSIVRSSRVVIVNSEVSGGEYDGTIVQWSVYKRDGELSVIDIGAENIWLGVEQRSQFTSFIADNGGAPAGIDKLIEDLRKRVAERDTDA